MSVPLLHSGRNESIPNQVLSSSEMALSFSSQGFAQSHIGERRLPHMCSSGLKNCHMPVCSALGWHQPQRSSPREGGGFPLNPKRRIFVGGTNLSPIILRLKAYKA